MSRRPRYECDRCGAQYDKNYATDVFGQWKHNLIGCYLANTSGKLMRFDLCDECLEELQIWLINGLGKSTDEDNSDE